MSTATERLRPRTGDEGFSLVEILVAIVIFAVIAFSALPVLMTGLKASAKARTSTVAKDLTQLRIERMRNLPFQVDRQNGPFVDLLDRYFTNASGATGPTGEAGCSGRYVTTGGVDAGVPAGPAYRVTCTNIPEAAGFTQVVLSQFLRSTGVTATPGTGYDSQVAGRDDAPSQLLGVTVLTTWNRGGQTGSLRTYTEIADVQGAEALLTTQAQSVALRVTSNDPVNSTSLVAQAGQVKADGSLTSGSIAALQATPALLDQVGVARASGNVANVVAPTTDAVPNPAGTSGQVTTEPIALGTGNTTSASFGSWVGCGWGWQGRSAHRNASATTAAGRPVVPADNGPDAAAAGAARTTAGLLNQGSGCGGFAFGFRNWLEAPAYAAGLGIRTDRPLVFVTDANAGGDVTSGPVRAQAGVTATDILANPRHGSAIAAAATSRVGILPVGTFTDGLVRATLTSSRLSCRSNAPVQARYELSLTWPGLATPQVFVYDTASAVVPTLPAPGSITFTVDGITRNLGEYLEWDLSSGVVEEQSGARSIDHVFSVTVPSTVVGFGGFTVQLGSLSCAAADNR